MAAKKKNEVTKASGSTALAEYEGFGAGAGWDNVGADDVSIPFLNLLQDTSKQVKKASPVRIEGAEAGHFMDSVSKTLYRDEENGVLIIPCFTEQKFVEWVPADDGGGEGKFVAAHDVNSPVAQEALQRNGGNRIGMTSEDGKHEIVQTFYVFGLIIDALDATESGNPVMLGISKTKLKPYRNYMGRVNKVKGSRALPLFANVIRLTSVPAVGQGFDYFNINMQPANPGETPEAEVVNSRLPAMVDGEPNPLMMEAMAFMKSVSGGTAKVDYASGGTEGDSTEGSDKHF